jgi:hypothetical protein
MKKPLPESFSRFRERQETCRNLSFSAPARIFHLFSKARAQAQFKPSLFSEFSKPVKRSSPKNEHMSETSPKKSDPTHL